MRVFVRAWVSERWAEGVMERERERDGDGVKDSERET